MRRMFVDRLDRPEVRPEDYAPLAVRGDPGQEVIEAAAKIEIQELDELEHAAETEFERLRHEAVQCRAECAKRVTEMRQKWERFVAMTKLSTRKLVEGREECAALDKPEGSDGQ